MLPGGNLREPLESMKRASVIAIPSTEAELEGELRSHGWAGPVWRLRRTMQTPTVAGPVAAFCGIARPEQFFSGLRHLGMEVVWQKVFADHHRYKRRDLDRMAEQARDAGAVALVTTEKDHVRLGNLGTAGVPLQTVRLETSIEDEAAALDWLVGQLKTAG